MAPLFGGAVGTADGEVTGAAKATGAACSAGWASLAGSPATLEPGTDGVDGRSRAAGAAGRGKYGATTFGPPMNATSRRMTYPATIPRAPRPMSLTRRRR